jgi:hypothetical protein
MLEFENAKKRMRKIDYLLENWLCKNQIKKWGKAKKRLKNLARVDSTRSSHHQHLVLGADSIATSILCSAILI